MGAGNPGVQMANRWRFRLGRRNPLGEFVDPFDLLGNREVFDGVNEAGAPDLRQREQAEWQDLERIPCSFDPDHDPVRQNCRSGRGVDTKLAQVGEGVFGCDRTGKPQFPPRLAVLVRLSIGLPQVPQESGADCGDVGNQRPVGGVAVGCLPLALVGPFTELGQVVLEQLEELGAMGVADPHDRTFGLRQSSSGSDAAACGRCASGLPGPKKYALSFQESDHVPKKPGSAEIRWTGNPYFFWT